VRGKEKRMKHARKEVPFHKRGQKARLGGTSQETHFGSGTGNGDYLKKKKTEASLGGRKGGIRIGPLTKKVKHELVGSPLLGGNF